MEIVLLWGAQADLLKAYERYGEPLHEKIDAALELVRSHPDIAPLYREQFHRKVVARSTYALYYTTEGERIMVAAVLDQRQDPDRIDERLGLT
jgi:plasmid stabilization system protein ParE